MEEILTKSYGRRELAALYCPEITPKSAWRKLKGWIAYNKDLTRLLALAGYNPRQRSFTPRQVALIFEYLGEP